MASQRFRLVSAASTNLAAVKPLGQSANVTGWVIINTNVAARYVKLYEPASQVAPTVGTTVPAITIQIPASSAVVHNIPQGIAFPQGIYLAATVNAVDSDATAVGAGDLIISVFYE